MFEILISGNLRDSERLTLARVRRDNAVNAFYTFDRSEHSVNQEFTKNMSAHGAFYETNIPLRWFPAKAAALLKYKKHEWRILAFGRNGVVDK
jgi:acetylglutamate synthase